MIKKIGGFYVLCLTTALCWGSAVVAKTDQLSDNQWHFMIAPYVWASAVSGNVTVENYNTDFKVSFSDIFKHMNFAAQGHMEAGFGALTFMVDPTYLKVSDKRFHGSIKPDVISATTLVDSGVFYRLLSSALADNREFSFELLGGARYFGVKNTLVFNQGLQLSNRVDMFSPIVGGRLKTDLSANTTGWLRADIGGFHVDNVNQTWSATAGLSYAIKKHIDLGLAYRVLKIDYLKKDATMNVLMHGPMIGVSFHH